MYKYKKTIIINNRRRRIFSKEKSNTEYILYKKEYITLNAYNKKTGGGLLRFIKHPMKMTKRMFSVENNEFVIPSKIIHPCSIINKDGIGFGLNTYDEINSIIISDYLKSNADIDTNTDKKWVITKYDKNNPNMNVKVYDKDGFEKTPETPEKAETDNLISYGNMMFLQNYTNYCSKLRISPNAVVYSKFISEYIHPEIYSKNILYFNSNDLNEDIIDKYKKLVKTGYHIYYILENLHSLIVCTNYIINNDYAEYKEGEYYKLFEDKYIFIFKCQKITKINSKYDISFKYISGGISEMDSEILTQNSQYNLISYGKTKHIEMIKKYNKINSIYDELITKFNEKIGANDINIENVLYYYDLANDNGISVYNSLIREGYFIYTIRKNTIYTTTNASFEYITTITLDGEQLYIFKYIDNSKKGGQRKYKKSL